MIYSTLVFHRIADARPGLVVNYSKFNATMTVTCDQVTTIDCTITVHPSVCIFITDMKEGRSESEDGGWR